MPVTASARPELPVQDNYAVAEGLAREALRGLDPARQADRVGGRLVERGGEAAVELAALGRVLTVTIPGGLVRDECGEEVSVWERVVVLHFVAGQDKVLSAGAWIGFAQVPSGSFYLAAFERRCHVPLARVFGPHPKSLLAAGAACGAVPVEFGDAAVRLEVLPGVPAVAVVHGGDEEFPASAKLLFDRSMSELFCTEDVAVIGSLVVDRLIKAHKRLQGAK